MSEQQKKLVMIGLMSLCVLAVVWRVLGTEEPAHVPLKYVSGQPGPREGSGGQPDSGLRPAGVDQLLPGHAKATHEFKKPKNIFAPLNMREEQAETAGKPVARGGGRRPLGSFVPPSAVAAPPPPPPSPEELAAQAARDELGRYRYLGYLNRQGRNQAVLAKEQKLHIVWTGETIEGRVMVKAITSTAVTLQEVPSQVEQILQLSSEGG
ncbi:MAG: hypothetical protein E8D45_03850 [Nitrospira sp.]|nr:MAG: hypothetical protein E8D45_03850 [Nitrospira sp.]